MAELNGTSLKSLSTLKAYYRFSAGTLTTDDSGNSHTLSAISDPAEDASGKYAGAVALDGNDAYSATDGADFKPTTAFTVSAWVKTTTADYQEIFQSYSLNTNVAGFYMELNDTGHLAAVSGKNSGTTPNTDYKVIVGGTAINDGAWHHVAYTWNGTHLNLYVDGVLDAVAVAWANAPVFAATNYVRVGCKTTDGSNDIFFIGSLDDLAFFNGIALTADQVSVLYSNSVRTLSQQGTGTSDTYISSSQPNTNYASDADFPIGEWSGGVDTLRELLWVDLSTIPIGCTIVTATLILTTKYVNGTASRTINIFRTKRDWVVNQATWNVYKTSNNWTTAGCGSTTDDYDNTSLGSIGMTAADPMNTARDITLNALLIQTMIPGGSFAGKGFILEASVESDATYGFHAADTATASYRPKLIIDYEPGVTTNYLRHHGGRRVGISTV